MHQTKSLEMPYQALSKIISPRLFTRIQKTGVEYKGVDHRQVEQQLRQLGENQLATELMRQLRQELNHKAG
jgi:hypothetical protein